MSQALAAAGFKSLSAVLAIGAGASFPTSGCCKFGIQVVLAGSPATAIVALELTLDTDADDTKNHWFTVATWDVATQTSGDILFVVDKPAAKMRANCTTLTTGAGKTVTAKLSAV